MKKIFYLLILAVACISFNACNNDNEANEAWKNANIDSYNAIKTNQEYQLIKTETGPEGVYYKAIKSGSGTESPLQTSKVKVLYKGTYYDGTVFDYGSSGNDIPVEFSLKSVVRGFSFALQNMVVGDKWEIWIPYYLGYGASGSYDSYTGQTIMRGYTTLVFEVELVSITRYP